MQTILLDHAHRYSKWEVKDLYKLIHQAAMGSEHAITDEAGARNWLYQEIAHLKNDVDEPLIDPISPDQQIVRVHLRPFLSHQLQPEQLLQAFIGTPRAVRQSREKLIEYASIAIQLAQEEKIPFKESQISEYFEQMRAKHFPAIHHSDKYEKFYRPAYRVIARELLPDEIIEAGYP